MKNSSPIPHAVVALLAVVALAVVALAGCGSAGSAQSSEVRTVTATAAAPVTETAEPVVDVVLPEVKGRNGRLVYDELRKLGLTNVSYASRDAEDKVVVNPANWTAVRIEPAAGKTIRSDEAVVVTMTKK